MNELEQALADIKQEGTDPFADLEETPSESLPEKEETVEEKAEEDNIPFHRHPRWIERENELKELRERDEQTARELAELKASRVEEKDTAIPDWFVELYGENQVAYNKYQEHEQARTTEIEERILARQREEYQREAQESEKWTKWVDTEVARLEADGLKFDKNKLIKTMIDYSPTDEHNNLSFDKGYKIYEAMEGKPDTAKSDARKQLADTVTKATTKGEPAQKDYMTSNDLRGRSMMSL